MRCFVDEALKEFDDTFGIVFLCGTEYKRNNISDKRNIVKRFVNSNFDDSNNIWIPIILEEHFDFLGKGGKLSYNCVGLRSLYAVEQMMMRFSSYIVILHETFSTAAEICAFASDVESKDKLLVFIPREVDVEENYLNGFLRLSFDAKYNRKLEKLVYFPEIKNVRLSEHLSKYFTYIPGNNIVKNGINDYMHNFFESVFVSKTKDFQFIQTTYSIVFDKNKLNDTRTYFFIQEYEIRILISFDFLKCILLSLFSDTEFRTSVREKDCFYEIRDYIVEYIEVLFVNQFVIKQVISISDISLYTITINLKKDLTMNISQAVVMFLYILKACNVINLSFENANSSKVRLSTAKNSRRIPDNFSGLIMNSEVSEFEKIIGDTR